MKLLARGTSAMIIALALVCGACGPSDGEAEIEVTTTDTGTSPPPVVVERDTTVIVNGGTDTVVQRDTVIQRQVDTVVQRRVDTVRTSVSASERARIDAWLRANDATLNQYGDPDGTMYTGGTPLFDERAGTGISRYDYIVRQHPDRPWMKPPQVEPQPAESQPSRPRR